MTKQTSKKGGPKTNEGKAVTRYNAQKHSLLSKEVLIEGEDQKILTQLKSDLYEAFEPQGPIEAMLVDRVVTNVWRLRRAVAVERNAMEFFKESDPIVFHGDPEKKGYKDMLDNQSIERTLRYETTIERSLYRALHELERLQGARNGGDKQLPAVVDVTVDTPSDGFVSQK